MCSIIGFEKRGISENNAKEAFEKTASRGPDMMRFEEAGDGWLGFERLSIMGLNEEGMQPFHIGKKAVVCNGELYNFRPLRAEFIAEGYKLKSTSDCEIILPMYEKYGVDMFRHLDAEFAMIIYDGETNSLIAARDPIGIRPLHYGYLKDGSIVFASEAKNLVGLCDRIMPFPPGCYWKDGTFTRYAEIYKGRKSFESCESAISTMMRRRHPRRSATCWSRLSRSVSTQMRRSASCSQAASTPRLSAQFPRDFSRSRSVHLPSA